MERCPYPRCHVPDVACRLGEPTPASCKHWLDAQGGKKAVAEKRGNGEQTLLPWTGTALGTDELLFLTGRGETRLVAIVGPHNAGKTTLLAAWYQGAGRSGRVGDHTFAGSFTLEGWEAVAHALRWEGSSPTFPPHTSSGAGRAPGMLHLAVRQEDDELVDFLFADSPGEWFQRWAIDSSAEDAEGARWLADRASVFLITADCEALSGSNRGNARSSLIQLIRRTAHERRGRPVALVWTKADIGISPNIRNSILEAAKLVMPEVAEFSCSVSNLDIDGDEIFAQKSMGDVLKWAVQPYPRGFTPSETRIASNDPFLNFGRTR
ncbi:hypothetical protein PMI07_006331 [Rhizobium sp. CF080]|uniref:TRAFAC clade GTPase domain-containing protein n=1 Tax=Rhizobium sp. (strain CF080) TaxID=1144310 RepID=UPI0002718116|nr:GTPase [Rhizobium sp. CF080]EUC00051.1 hypothetical protein PMI07_006331 [Rhizobium sp. CF080]